MSFVLRTPLVLETLTAPLVIVSILFHILGLFSLYQGWKIYTEPAPRFVTSYRGWSSTLLTLPYGGVWALCMGNIAWAPIAPLLLMRIISIIWLLSGIITLLGFLIWFPRFLLPPWYRRALKAGIPRHDPYAMGAFKTLPLEEQKAAAQSR